MATKTLKMEDKIVIKQATLMGDFLVAKALIAEYVEWLGFDLAFQNFDDEMATLPETYSEPNGVLYVAIINEKPVGVAGIKRFNERECEVKRMFVQFGYRGLGIGQLLLTQCVAAARQLNYSTIKLDTTDSMKPAIHLYTKNGFIEIPAYRFNPHEEARYYEVKLK